MHPTSSCVYVCSVYVNVEALKYILSIVLLWCEFLFVPEVLDEDGVNNSPTFFFNYLITFPALSATRLSSLSISRGLHFPTNSSKSHFTQSSHLNRGLPRFLVSSTASVSFLFSNFSSSVLSTHHFNRPINSFFLKLSFSLLSLLLLFFFCSVH